MLFAKSLALDFVSKKNDEFIDTIIAVGDTNNKGPVLDYFSYFNLRENGTLDDRNVLCTPYV